MGLPEEDRGPAWLRDWGRETGHTDLDTFTGTVDPNALSVDISSMIAFAQALHNEHQQDYRPHVQTVFDQMTAVVSAPDERFIELTESLTHHRDMLVQTSTAIANHDKAIIAFVEAAMAIGKEYRNADALSAATVYDVETGLSNTSTTRNAQPDTVITPEQAEEQTNTPTDPAVTADPAAPAGDGSADGGQEVPGA
jgi:hypothetical protein